MTLGESIRREALGFITSRQAFQERMCDTLGNLNSAGPPQAFYGSMGRNSLGPVCGMQREIYEDRHLLDWEILRVPVLMNAANPAK